MHCKSCEILLENQLKEIKWIKINKIDFKKWLLDLDSSDTNILPEIERVVCELWYSLTENKINNQENYLNHIITFLLFIAIWMFLFLLKDIKLFWTLISSDNLSFLVIFLVWITASMSTCLAITWWIVIWFSQFLDKSSWISSHIKVQSMFHLWRITWFIILWWILWSLWSMIWNIWILNKILLFLAWFLMIYMWFYMLKLLPSISKFWISMPKIFANKILNIKNPAFAPIIWALTFFLPCWFTQSMQIYAISSSSFLSWAMIMWVFALWTAPVLILVWVWSSYFKEKKFNLLNKIIAIIVIYFGIFTLSWFSNLLNLNIPNNTNQSINNQANSNLIELKKIVVWHNWSSLVPSEIVLEWAKNYELTINPTSDWEWCLLALIIPWIDNSEHYVKKWIPIIINIRNPTLWEYKVVCTSMWMWQWSLLIK